MAGQSEVSHDRYSEDHCLKLRIIFVVLPFHVFSFW